jgi:ribosomal protein L11 methyltransferase
VEVYEGDISSVEGTFDMIAANLISGTLIELAKDISERLRPGGMAVLSGILRGQDDEVVAAVERAALECTERLRDGKWISLACRR